MKLKRCSDCLISKPLSEFHKNSAAPDGLRYLCKSCGRAAQRRWYLANRERAKATADKARLQSKYGITPEQYADMLYAQNYVCKICEAVNGSGVALAVDHDHVSGTIRGLLCTACNTALGKFKDDPKLLRRAAEYLEGVSE